MDIGQLPQVTVAPFRRNSLMASFIKRLIELKYGFSIQNSFHENFTSINNAKKVFKMCSRDNVMTEDARVTQASRPHIDLIVAKRNGLISTARIFPP